MNNIEINCNYIGIHIVSTVIEANKKHEREGIQFILANACEDELPTADVALFREVLFHLSFKDNNLALDNIKKSVKWLIATTDTSIWFNSDIPTGDYRKLNLQSYPFKSPPSTIIIVDNMLVPDRVLGVWRTSDL